MRQFATGAAVVAVVALVVGLYPPAAGLVGLVVVSGSALSALYLWRIYRRSERPVLFSAALSLVTAIVVAGAWFMGQQAYFGLTGDRLAWAYPVNVGVLAALLAIPMYWAFEVHRLRREAGNGDVAE